LASTDYNLIIFHAIIHHYVSLYGSKWLLSDTQHVPENSVMTALLCPVVVKKRTLPSETKEMLSKSSINNIIMELFFNSIMAPLTRSIQHAMHLPPAAFFECLNMIKELQNSANWINITAPVAGQETAEFTQ
jgi:hypothetical protein